MIRLFCGYDEREAIGFHVFVHSVLQHATAPVCLYPLNSRGLPCGSNSFTYSRFLVPWLCGFQGHAIFMDGSDMLMQGDVAELTSLCDDQHALRCVQHADYSTSHPRKYRGTSMECDNRNYWRKNWASVMLMNCAHPHWRKFTPLRLPLLAGLDCLQFRGLTEDEIGQLPDAWNRLVDEGQPTEGAKVLHFTAGIPSFPAYHDSPGADAWRSALDTLTGGLA